MIDAAKHKIDVIFGAFVDKLNRKLGLVIVQNKRVDVRQRDFDLFTAPSYFDVIQI